MVFDIKIRKKTLKIKLVAFNLPLFYAWKKYFDRIENVEIIDGDILSQQADAIVSPANSFGYMDGGLDLKYSQHFGWELEDKLRAVLEEQYFGEIPVGQSIIIKIDNDTVKYLICAPTMRVPMNVANTANAYLAFKGILQAVQVFNKKYPNSIQSIVCPGLATGEGKMPAERCALQMREAYRVCMEKGMLKNRGLATAARHHMKLLEKDF